MPSVMPGHAGIGGLVSHKIHWRACPGERLPEISNCLRGIDALFLNTAIVETVVELISGSIKMKRPLKWRGPNWTAWVSASLLGLILLLCASPSQAQRRGVRTGGDAPGAAAPPTAPGVTDFERELAIQATSDQRLLFSDLSQSLEAAGQRTRAFLKVVDSDTRPSDYSLQVIGLRDLLEKAGENTGIFTGSLNAAQKSRLKAQAKRLTRAGAVLARHAQSVEQESMHPSLDRQGLVKLAEDLVKALENVKTEQLRMGKLMGIPEQDYQ